MQQLQDYDSTILLSVAFSSSLSKQLKTFTATSNIYLEFNHSKEETSPIKNIDEFVRNLFAEMKNRTTLLKKKRLVVLPSMVVLMDDIFEVLRSHNRKTTNAFIQLLRKSSLVGIYFVIGSSGIYRNLLQQIINTIPTKVDTDKTFHTVKSSAVLGAELVMSFDGLIFFKEKSKEVYTKYYPLEKSGL